MTTVHLLEPRRRDAACGSEKQWQSQGLALTSDPDKVNCNRCRSTWLYRDSAPSALPGAPGATATEAEDPGGSCGG